MNCDKNSWEDFLTTSCSKLGQLNNLPNVSGSTMSSLSDATGGWCFPHFLGRTRSSNVFRGVNLYNLPLISIFLQRREHLLLPIQSDSNWNLGSEDKSFSSSRPFHKLSISSSLDFPRFFFLLRMIFHIHWKSLFLFIEKSQTWKWWGRKFDSQH